MTNKQRITKTEFEHQLLNNFENVSGRKIRERHVDNITTLYYENDTHIASWSNGKGWMIEV